MDPELQDSTCLCPQMGCRDGLVNNFETDEWEECPRCEGMGYVVCDDVKEEEAYITVAQERSKVVVVALRN
jgi:hypothetical protein